MKKAFTLIELMVVISIISILAAISLPRFTDITDDARVAQVQGNLLNLRTSIEMFHVKNEEYPVYGEVQPASSNSSGDISSDGSLSEAFTAFYSKNSMPETPASEEASATNQVVKERDDSGGWLYIEESGLIYANLKNGNYTGNEGNEIWNEAKFSEEDEDGSGGDNGGGSTPAPAPGPDEKIHSVTGVDLESFIKSGSWFEDFLSAFEYNEDTEALELTGALTIGRIKLDSSNTELEKVAKISLKTNSELENWELTGGPDTDGHYTYTQAYEPPKSTAGGGFEVEVDFDGFLGLFDDHAIYEISYE
ncbi:hypothetical protein PM10SUCC1_13560 [Propionigenium maris DSM 9537]|uniref:Prepilin-type N-terminal cleavage/methylation domain-containing protein n=1 Tax=Propionigenium maris DSM 9537 TaxID=1123000 RepID=A0A9W6GLM9_9FUSO|nr:prepilin-type N-terminal cleavage/methylation domain-containing protein [Propionigenium maris]GLI55842.1 hypothetical protein PM10SUCC1_13560 [Propionigenium maris DSM 9537]